VSEQAPYRIDARVKDYPLYYVDGREVSKRDFLDRMWVDSKYGPRNGRNGHNGTNQNGAE
jgi:hypothetical protein